jgi:hypothetical protein
MFGMKHGVNFRNVCSRDVNNFLSSAMTLDKLFSLLF